MPSSQYNPVAEQPYQPYEAPQPTPAPPPPVAAQTPGFQFNGTPVSHVGAVAGVLDNILRGYMQGRVQRDAKKVMQVKAKTDNLQNSYQQDAKLLYSLAQSGTPKDSPEFQQAVSAVQGSWGALQDWIGQHVNDGDDGKKKKGKKGDQPQNPQMQTMADLQSPDPNVKAKALYQLSQKFGPPVLGQVAQFYTPEAQAQRKTGELQTQNALSHEQAQATYDKYAGTDPSKLTEPQRQEFENAKAIILPPRQTGTTRQYRGPDGSLNWYIPGNEPEGYSAVATGGTKPYKLKDGTTQYFVPGNEPEGATATTTGASKLGSVDDFIRRKYGDNPTDEQVASALRERANALHVGGGRGGATEDKNWNKWEDYYKKHRPDMSEDERDAAVRKKIEGGSQLQSDEIAHDAITEPQQFDNDVISTAVENVRRLPQYAKMATFDDAVANIVGQGDNGYQYHKKSDLGQPDSSGKYSGGVDQKALTQLERDIQNQIRLVLTGSKLTGLTPAARRAALGRMAPLFGPAAQGSGSAPVSPQAKAAPQGAGASSPPPSGGSKPTKGIVKKSAFLKDNPGATEADWKAVKPQLQSQGFDPKDE